MTWPVHSVRFCVCIVKDGRSDRVEGTRDDCVSMMVEMTGMPEEEADGYLLFALFVAEWGFTEPFELAVERL